MLHALLAALARPGDNNVSQALGRPAHLRRLSSNTTSAEVQAHRMRLVKWLCDGEQVAARQAMFPCMFAYHLRKNRGMLTPAERKADNEGWAAWLKKNKLKQLTDFWSMFDLYCAQHTASRDTSRPAVTM